jgi:hypothetical protein
MRLTELFEDDTPSPAEWMEAWTAAVRDLQDLYDGQTVSKINSKANSLYMNAGTKIDASGAIERAETLVTNNNKLKQRKAERLAQKRQKQQSKQTTTAPAQATVKPTITAPADRNRTDSLGRNLKADRYYNQLNKTPRGRNILKQVSQKLGLPPESEEVIDYVADNMPKVFSKLNTILKDPASMGGKLNPRNRR